jgi:Cu+-exporting ATPase
MSCCSETSAEVVKDPVCGMKVDPAKAAGQSQNQGLTYSFCSVGCKNKFDLNPAHYIQGNASSSATFSRCSHGRRCNQGEEIHLSHAPGGAGG